MKCKRSKNQKAIEIRTQCYFLINSFKVTPNLAYAWGRKWKIQTHSIWLSVFDNETLSTREASEWLHTLVIPTNRHKQKAFYCITSILNDSWYQAVLNMIHRLETSCFCLHKLTFHLTTACWGRVTYTSAFREILHLQKCLQKIVPIYSLTLHNWLLQAQDPATAPPSSWCIHHIKK